MQVQWCTRFLFLFTGSVIDVLYGGARGIDVEGEMSKTVFFGSIEYPAAVVMIVNRYKVFRFGIALLAGSVLSGHASETAHAVHVGRKIRHTARITPLVVIPADHLGHVAGQNLGELDIHDGRMGVALEVTRDKGFLRTLEDPFQFFWAAVLRTDRKVSVSVSVSRTAVKSTTETVGVGTLMEKPSNRPSIPGMTSANARAAPVVVGMMF